MIPNLLTCWPTDFPALRARGVGFQPNAAGLQRVDVAAGAANVPPGAAVVARTEGVGGRDLQIRAAGAQTARVERWPPGDTPITTRNAYERHQMGELSYDEIFSVPNSRPLVMRSDADIDAAMRFTLVERSTDLGFGISVMIAAIVILPIAATAAFFEYVGEGLTPVISAGVSAGSRAVASMRRSASIYGLTAGSINVDAASSAPNVEVRTPSARVRREAQRQAAGAASGQTSFSVEYAENGPTRQTAVTVADGSVSVTDPVGGESRTVSAGSAVLVNSPVYRTEDFANPATGIFGPTSTPPQYSLAYVDGEYQINKIDGTWPFIPLVYMSGWTDAALGIEARVEGGHAERYVALFCRWSTTNGTGYRLIVSPDYRQFKLSRLSPGVDSALTDWRVSSAIRAGNEMNRIELSCVGSRVAGTINGVEVTAVTDGTYSTGALAMGGSAFAGYSLPADWRFDNLVIRGPAAFQSAAYPVPIAVPTPTTAPQQPVIPASARVRIPMAARNSAGVAAQAVGEPRGKVSVSAGAAGESPPPLR